MCAVGDSVSFCAEVYRYVKTGNGKLIDYGLRNPTGIQKIEAYELPSDDELIMQEVEQLICETCFLSEQCNRNYCTMDPKKKRLLKQEMFRAIKAQTDKEDAEMKRFFLMWGLVVALLLSGCGSSASRVETLKSWSFQYNEGTSDYSLFFGLADKNDKSLSADVDVGIRIVNDADEEVYTGTKSVYTDDFSYYTSQAAGEQYLANVRIPAAEIKAGKSASGKIYFTVYKGKRSSV